MFSYFFRGVEDGRYPFEIFGPTHLLLLAFWVVVTLLLFKYRSQLFRSGWATKLRKGLAAVLLLDQLVLYAWNIGSGHFHLEMGLPLYPCRIAVILLSIACLFNARWAWPLGFVWGVMGSLAGMVLADPYQFDFPHYTNFQFFIVHLGMLWLIMLRCSEMLYSKAQNDSKNIFFANNLFIFVSFVTNLVLNRVGIAANYGYLVEPPEFLLGILRGHNVMYTLLMLLLYNVVSYGLSILARIVLDKYYGVHFGMELEEDSDFVRTEI